MGIHIPKTYNEVIDELGRRCWRTYMSDDSLYHSASLVAFIYGHTEDKVQTDIQRALDLLRDRLPSS